MRAIAEDEFGGPVTLMNLPIPEIGADEVLIRVRAAGVNPFDWKVADGVLKDEKEHRFPLILGFDAAGVIERVGADVTRLFEGDEVYGYLSKPVMGMGTYAEHVGAPAAIVAKKPESVGFAEAAALPTPALTAMDLVDAVDLGEGKTILIVGATGGVGSYAVQLAARRGARVIATARQANEAFVWELPHQGGCRRDRASCPPRWHRGDHRRGERPRSAQPHGGARKGGRQDRFLCIRRRRGEPCTA
jgi:NADPH:quinone reductase-like Zn-dependent oxidoreductase